MGLEVQAWSRLTAETSNFMRLRELGLVASEEHEFEVREEDLRPGGLETGNYWRTAETRDLHFEMGSYSFSEGWRESLVKSLPRRARPDWTPFLEAWYWPLRLWGPRECSHHRELWERWGPQILLGQEPEERDLFERNWYGLYQAWSLGADAGAVMIY